ncbi:MAG: hypothetical protein K0R71_210 [Bacillales bacterium]|nr:hypothetical protein [Bacillales bacterium]
MAQAIRLLGIIAFAAFISFGLYSNGIVYVCLFLFVLYLVIGNSAIRRTFQFLKPESFRISKTKKSRRKNSKLMKRAKKLGLTIYSSHSTSTSSSNEQNVIPKLSVINGKRSR